MLWQKLVFPIFVQNRLTGVYGYYEATEKSERNWEIMPKRKWEEIKSLVNSCLVCYIKDHEGRWLEAYDYHFLASTSICTLPRKKDANSFKV